MIALLEKKAAATSQLIYSQLRKRYVTPMEEEVMTTAN